MQGKQGEPEGQQEASLAAVWQMPLRVEPSIQAHVLYKRS